MHRCQGGEANNGVHRRTNIMGHAVEEGGFGLRSMLSRLQSNASLALRRFSTLKQKQHRAHNGTGSKQDNAQH